MAKSKTIYEAYTPKTDPNAVFPTSSSTNADPRTVYVNNKPTLWA